MELDNYKAKQAYIQLLNETLGKKKELLICLTNLTEQQEEVIASDTFDEALFNETVSLKDNHIRTLNELDEGFEKLYESVKTELISNKHNYMEEIKALQELIADITDLSVKLQALEKRNKSKLEILFARKRKEIKTSRLSSKTAANYYKTMSKQQEVQSLFYDKKK